MFQESNQTKAMVEVALALAMGFFSIMVLAMVSMSAGTGNPGGLANFHKPLKVESQKPKRFHPDSSEVIACLTGLSILGGCGGFFELQPLDF